MFNKLFRIEYEASKNYLALLVAANIVLLGACWYNQNSTYIFSAMTTLAYWVAIIANYSSFSDHKRTQLYTQLPTTHFQVFFSGWLVAFLWLGITAGFWLLYALTIDAAFTVSDIPKLASNALGMLLLMFLISIAIDLSAFEPKAVQWGYVSALVLFFAIANNLELFSNNSTRVDDDNFRIFPFGFESLGLGPSLLAAAICILLIFVNYEIYKKSENFLR